MAKCVIVAPAVVLGPDGEMCVVLEELIEIIEHLDHVTETSVGVLWQNWAALWTKEVVNGIPYLGWVKKDGHERGNNVPDDRDTREILLPKEFGERLLTAVEAGGCRARLKEHRHLFGDSDWDSIVTRRNGTNFIM